MRIAMIGTRGVPARYGGFETAVEEIGSRLAARGHGVTVYCRNSGQRMTTYEGMRLVNLPSIRTKITETLSHSVISAAHAIVRDRPDVAFVFNPSNAPVIPALQAAGIPVAVNMDGLESRRAKWHGWAARYIRWAEQHSMTTANVVIADSRAIAREIAARCGRQAVYIPYGAGPGHPDRRELDGLGLRSEEFVLVVARFEPENQVDRIVAAYRDVPGDLPLVVVGNGSYSHDHVAVIQRLAARDSRVRLLGAIHDRRVMDTLYTHARLYVHGHMVGGTNPSLLRAVRVAPVVAYDTPFAREVMGYAAAGYWASGEQLTRLIAGTLALPRVPGLTDIFDARFDWGSVTDAYEGLARCIGDISGRKLRVGNNPDQRPTVTSDPATRLASSHRATGRGAA